MSISGISPAGLSVNTAAGANNALAAQATQLKALSVQDEISMAVLNQIQDQQKMMADGLVEMMKNNLIDIYA
jgi:hypothetical protein